MAEVQASNTTDAATHEGITLRAVLFGLVVVLWIAVLEYACRVYRPHFAYEYQPFPDGVVVYIHTGGVAESVGALDQAAIRAVSDRVAGGTGDGAFGRGHSRLWFDEFFSWA